MKRDLRIARASRLAACALLIIIFTLVAPAVPAADTAAVTAAIGELQEADWQLRERAAKSLGESGDTGSTVVSALTAALQDDDSRVRRAAATALGQLGSKASKSVPSLVGLFDDVDAGVSAAAAAAIGNMGSRASRAVPELSALLSHEDKRVQIAAAEALGKIGPRAEKGAQELGKQLESRDPGVRIAAAESLGKLGSGASKYSSRLVQLLDDRDAQVRTAASTALVRIGKGAVPPLLRSLNKGDPVFLQAAVETLGDMGSVAVPGLVKSLQETHGQLLERRYAALALARIGAANRRVIPALIESLDDDKPDIRAAALEALGQIGPAAETAVGRLIATSADQGEPLEVRESALAAMARIAPADAAVNKALVAAVADGNPGIYKAAVAALVEARARLSSGSQPGIAGLVQQLESGSEASRLAAARKLGEYGSFAVAAVPGLTSVLADRDNNLDLRTAAAMSLGLIGPEAESAVPELIRTLEDGSELLRDTALVALDRIGPQTQTVPALLQAMRSGSLSTRASAAQKVRSFAEARKAAWVPLLSQSDAPVIRNWLSRYGELYGVEATLAEIRSRRGDDDSPDYFDVMGGRAAIRESVQLDLIANPLAGDFDLRTIAVSSVDPVAVESHPFDEMLKGSKLPKRRVPLAELTPQDRSFFWFRNLEALRQVFAGTSDQFLRFESALSAKSVEYDVERRYLERLGLTDEILSQMQALSALEDLAIITPDLFLVDGTDVTIVANLSSAGVAQAVLSTLGLAGTLDAGHASRTLPGGDEVYWAIRGATLVISSNLHELRRVLSLQGEGGEDSLGQSAEFLYMQQQIGVEDETQAYAYFSDAFIRRLVSPEVKIAQLRRMQARAEMETLVSAALLYLLDGNRHIPSKEQLIQHRYLPTYYERRDYTLSDDLIVTSETYGSVARLKPLSANVVTNITERERDAYDSFVDNYSNYWRQFFDPIAIRMDRVDEDTMEMTTFILPLLDSVVYDQVRDALATNESGRRLDVPVLTPTPSMVVSLNLSDDLRVDLSKELTSMLVRYTSVNPEIFDSIGSGVHLAVQDSTPIVALGSGDIWGAMDQEMLRMEGFESLLPFMLSVLTQPSTVLIELTEPDRVRQFLSAAVVLRSDGGGEGELHKLQDKEAWIYSINVLEMFQLHLRIEINDGYLMISNLPWSTQLQIDGLNRTPLNGAKMQINLDHIQRQLPALHTKIFTDYRAAAVDGMGYLYPLMVTGISETVDEALAKHAEIFGFRPVHPSSGRWFWRDSYLTSSQFGTASYPVQPEFAEGDRNFGIFPDLSLLSVNMQLEDTGLRATVRWQFR